MLDFNLKCLISNLEKKYIYLLDYFFDHYEDDDTIWIHFNELESAIFNLRVYYDFFCCDEEED